MKDGKKIVCIIPARLESTRLPEKPLKDILGLPMIVHVYKRALLCKDLDAVYVATDSEKIKKVVEENNGKAILTSKDHATGTDRIGEAVKDIDCDLVINLQGDEPLVRPEHITESIKGLLSDNSVRVSCLCVETDQFNNASEIKLVLNKDSDIMYFSRSDIPSSLRVRQTKVLKQYCIYAFEKDFLLEYVNWNGSPLESVEFVELLRVLENGHKIKGVLIRDAIVQSVDTEEDLETVRSLMQKDSLKEKYM